MSASNSVLSHIARPYAVAVFELARDAGTIAETEASLDQIRSLIADSDDFARFIGSPAISAQDKRKAIEVVLERSDQPELVRNFISILAKNGRLFALPDVIEAYKALAAASRNEVRADITSAAPLTDTQRDQLARTLTDKIGKTITLNTRVDESLIGGLIVKVGSKMIDTSLKTKLSAMKIAMKGVS